jgi:hypothetical protein
MNKKYIVVEHDLLFYMFTKEEMERARDRYRRNGKHYIPYFK